MIRVVDSTRVRSGYTQNKEEAHILEAVKTLRTGKFLDIGAHDGKSFSSTRALVERGWSGYYVEPDPSVLPSLYANAAEFGNRVRVLPVAIGTKDSKMPFYSSKGDMVGSLEVSHVNKWSDRRDFELVEVNVVTLNTLSTSIGTQFDFINLDVEGLNWDVFTQFDWKLWNPKCVCIEYDNKLYEMAEIMQRNNYKITYTSPENLVAVRKDLRWTGRGFV